MTRKTFTLTQEKARKMEKMHMIGKLYLSAEGLEMVMSKKGE